MKKLIIVKLRIEVQILTLFHFNIPFPEGTTFTIVDSELKFSVPLPYFIVGVDSIGNFFRSGEGGAGGMPTPDDFIFPYSPYGNGSHPLSGYIAIAESWAENIGREFTGINRERLTFESGYIPEGLFNDLEDINTSTFDINNGIRDNISGFSRGQLFDALTPNCN
ncbi:MAG: hypothetical protein R2771_05610 [Saprospiraceae bacterium]